MLFEYFNIFFFLALSVALFIFLSVASVLLSPQDLYLEKITSYECGFQSFEFHITNFEIKYYVVAILFLVFDLELLFFIPWIYSISYLSTMSTASILYFFIVLTIGFYYEWRTKSLDFLENSDS